MQAALDLVGGAEGPDKLRGRSNLMQCAKRETHSMELICDESLALAFAAAAFGPA